MEQWKTLRGIHPWETLIFEGKGFHDEANSRPVWAERLPVNHLPEKGF
jgi:hypothetical protein